MPSPQPLPENPEDEWDLEEWLELMGPSRPSGSATFNLNAQSDKLQIKVEANKVRSALSQILGYAYADDGAPYQLYRPACGIQHPYYPWLWSMSATVTLRTPMGNPDKPVVGGGFEPKNDAIFSGGYGPEFFGRYMEAIIDVEFGLMRWRILTDDDPQWSGLPIEYRRNFANDGTEPSLDFISAEGANENASFIFAERATDEASPAIGTGGTPFTGSVLRRKQQTRYRTLWKNVPLNYLVGEYGFNSTNYHRFLMPNPRRLLRSLGTVNSAPFPGSDGQPAGTLLFDSLRLFVYQQPVQSDKEIGLWAVDVGMDFVHFDPKRPVGPTTTPPTVGNWTPSPSTTPVADRKRGHHLVPFRESKAGYWYFASCGSSTQAGTYSGGSQLEETDFNDLFYHVDDPAHPIPD